MLASVLVPMLTVQSICSDNRVAGTAFPLIATYHTTDASGVIRDLLPTADGDTCWSTHCVGTLSMRYQVAFQGEFVVQSGGHDLLRVNGMGGSVAGDAYSFQTNGDVSVTAHTASSSSAAFTTKSVQFTFACNQEEPTLPYEVLSANTIQHSAAGAAELQWNPGCRHEVKIDWDFARLGSGGSVTLKEVVWSGDTILKEVTGTASGSSKPATASYPEGTVVVLKTTSSGGDFKMDYKCLPKEDIVDPVTPTTLVQEGVVEVSSGTEEHLAWSLVCHSASDVIVFDWGRYPEQMVSNVTFSLAGDIVMHTAYKSYPYPSTFGAGSIEVHWRNTQGMPHYPSISTSPSNSPVPYTQDVDGYGFAFGFKCSDPTDPNVPPPGHVPQPTYPGSYGSGDGDDDDSGSGGSSMSLPLIIGLAGGGFVLLIIIIVVVTCCVYHHRKPSKTANQKTSPDAVPEEEAQEMA